MEAINYEDGIILAEKNFATIKSKGKKFLERNAEKYLREKLFIPFYITENSGSKYMFIIHPPDKGKIFFKKFSIKNE